ncbi:hypothetical protein Salat_2295400 [Sesamum alatum]|uniref:PRC-barrel domain-containing protein n=1 Tax=Sesamum alatum TaxID=300844 RepID=A0AAE1XVI2_9LAMI|nr:hypothetical protein Salat_2295400 [Sesamum alatum]
MCDCLPSLNFPPQNFLKLRQFGFAASFNLSKYAKLSIPHSKKISICINSARDRDAIPFPSDEHEYEDLDFGLLEKERIRRAPNGKKDEQEMGEPATRNGADEEAQDFSSIGEIFKFKGAQKDNKLVKDDDNAKPQGLDSKLEELERHDYWRSDEVAKSRRQMMRRSNIIAKQVISIRSALSLGYVSQLWVDTSSWTVIVVEVRPNLLSGDFERFLLKEITQVGDVILVEDENVLEDDFKLVGLETLVGYTVVTPSRQSIGKVRGYTFNINSGTVESLELDSFGISIIPSSLVSTYSLFVEDVKEVLSDTVIGREAAVSRIQRLTKGFWDGQYSGISNDEFDEQLDINGQQNHADYREKRRKSWSRQKLRSKMRKSKDDWELPMDYL